MAKKSKKKTKEKTKKKTREPYEVLGPGIGEKKKKKKDVDYKIVGGRYVSNGKAYERSFKKEKGDIKIFKLKISKKETLKLKVKYNKKNGRVVILNTLSARLNRGGGPGMVYCNDAVSMCRHIEDFARRSLLLSEISRKKTIDVEKILKKLYKIDIQIVKSMYEMDFVFNKKKLREKIRGELSKKKDDRKSRKNKKSNRR